MSIEQAPEIDALERVITALQTEKPRLAEQYALRSLGVFGSHARGEAHTDSDLDILVEFASPPTLFEFVRLQNELSDHLGIKVDLVMKSALKPMIGEHILDEVILV